jgi:hypothetical protein
MYQGNLDYLLTTSIAQAMGPYLFNTPVMVSWIVAFIGGCNSIHSHGVCRLLPIPLSPNMLACLLMSLCMYDGMMDSVMSFPII